MTTCYLVPVGKPRMTKRDQWLKRPSVVKYRIFADALRQCMQGVDLSDVWCMSLTFYMPFPKSYSQKKRDSLSGKVHREKSDLDNCVKATLDALIEEDKGVAGILAWKYWDDGKGARIESEINQQGDK